VWIGAILEHIDFLDAQIAGLTEAIGEQIAPFEQYHQTTRRPTRKSRPQGHPRGVATGRLTLHGRGNPRAIFLSG
jgi:hypothetical protein